MITFFTPERAAEVARTSGASFRFLVDGERAVYRAYGLGALRARDMLTWDAIVKIAGARSSSFHRPAEDARQLGGDFVVGTDGRLCLAHASRYPGDRPGVEAILRAAAG